MSRKTKSKIDFSKNTPENAQYFLDHYQDRLPPPGPEINDKRHWTEIVADGSKILADKMKQSAE